MQEIFQLSQQRWARMFFALGELLVSRSGLLCVRRFQLTRAIKRRCVERAWKTHAATSRKSASMVRGCAKL